MEQTTQETEALSISVELEYDRTVNYAMQQNDVPVIKNLRVTNRLSRPLYDIVIRIRTEPSFAKTWETRIDSLAPDDSFTQGFVDLILCHDYLAGLTERVAGTLHVDIEEKGMPVHSSTRKIDVLACHEWNGLQSLPEILAAFVTPNHPAVEAILSKAAAVLGTWTDDASLSGYQSRDPRRVTFMAAAIFEAIRQQNIRYINPPASFETMGQKIRLPEQILENKLATCLDLSVLTASCLEQAGLHPLVVLVEGHAFCGVWLEEETFADAATDDLLRLRKRVDLEQITLFETTLVTWETAATFDPAVKEASKHLENPSGFRCVLDIKTCRKNRIRPLPLGMDSANIQSTGISYDGKGFSAAPAHVPSLSKPTLKTADSPAETPATRLDRWKRKLLDLTLNNRLLNFRESKKNLPILCPDLGSLEDALADGNVFRIYPRIDNLGATNGRNADVHLNRTGKEALSEMLREEFKARRLRADVTDVEIGRRLLEIYREAKLSLEENGANTLYLALGFLSWYETKTSPRQRLAPLILIPLEIQRKSIQEGFTIRQADDEPMVNVTLLAHLASVYGLTVSGLDPIPMDEHGIDVPLVLRTFREAVVGIDRWEVLETAHIGHFSFTKFLMWRDLDLRSDDLEKNGVVRHLIHTPTAAYPDDGVFPDPERLDQTHSPETTFCPLSADSSQLAAVYASAAGKSFILHGPPGTGKSQTITNIIAHNMALGKTVLFVSEKRAALEVVHRRLTESGLGPFCLELHSNKSSKKDVLTQFGEALEANGESDRRSWIEQSMALAQSREELNIYVSALHAVRESGETIFHGLARLTDLRNAPVLKFQWPDIRLTKRETLNALRETVRRVRVAAAEIDDPASHVWASATCRTWSPDLRNTALQALMDLESAAITLEKTLPEAANITGMIRNTANRSDIGQLAKVSAALYNCPAIPQELFLASDFETLKGSVLETTGHGRQRDRLREQVYTRFTPDILTIDLHSLIRTWAKAGESWFLPRFFRARKVVKALKSVIVPGLAVDRTSITADLEQAIALRSEEELIKETPSWVKDAIPGHWKNGEADWAHLEDLVTRAENLRKHAVTVAGLDMDRAAGLRNTWAALAASGGEQLGNNGPAGQRLLSFLKAFKLYLSHENTLISVLGIDGKTAWSGSEGEFLKNLVRRCSLWRQNMNSLKDWCNFQSVRHDAMAQGLQPLVVAYESGRLPCDAMVDAFDKGYYTAWCDAAISAEPALCGFVRRDFEDRIKRFRDIDSRYTHMTRKEIHARLAAMIPEGQALNPNSEMGILRRQMQKQRGHLPVRSLIRKIPNLLARLKPCLLMSPISVAQYLDPGHPAFDLVVFDEASQIPVWDAVGVIARGKDAVIVGDPKQLPPTSFFMKADSEGDSDEDDTSVEDLESILDDCMAAQLPQRHLNWHYRSRHESLIAFSNTHYYGNRLFTFPSPRTGMGVTFRHVEGSYDKGLSRTNKAEAHAVVAEVLQRLNDSTGEPSTLGIVTFSIAQQRLIDDLLEVARQNHPHLEHHFADSSDEAVFVKNLENVQGDERDVILFSICYGPDAQNRISMNFGPMNRNGGERRLNVAITRARKEVVVFSTLRAEHIDLTRTRSKGAADLKAFLDYAERGPAVLTLKTTGDAGKTGISSFEKNLALDVVSRGHTVHQQVGCSGFRIDLGIVDPTCPGSYTLGIICDGANYHTSRTARDRDMLRESVLEGLGWNLHRVWSMDYLENPEQELSRIDAAVRTAIDKANQPVRPSSLESPAKAQMLDSQDASPEEKIMTEEPVSLPDTGLPDYIPYPQGKNIGTIDDFFNDRSITKIRQLVEGIVTQEGPVSLDLTARRIAEFWDITRLTSRVTSRIEEALARAEVTAIRDGDRLFLWPTDVNPETYSIFRVPSLSDRSKRNAEDLPPQETANAVRYVLKQHVSLPMADLVRESARLLGFQRTGMTIDKIMRMGITRLLELGEATEENGMIVDRKMP